MKLAPRKLLSFIDHRASKRFPRRGVSPGFHLPVMLLHYLKMSRRTWLQKQNPHRDGFAILVQAEAAKREEIIAKRQLRVDSGFESDR